MFRPVSLRFKILVLIFVPLILQLALLAIVANLQNQAEDEARRAECSRQIADEVIDISHDLVLVRTNMHGEQSIPADPTLGRQYQTLAESIDRHFSNLRRLTVDKPALAQAVEKAIVSMRQSKNLMDEARAEFRAGKLEGKVGRYKYVVRFRNLTRELSDQLLGLGDAGKAEADASPEIQRKFREEVQFVLIGGGVANIFLTLLLGVILTRSIVNRLKIMNDNSYRLASDKPLNQLVSGNDEIAQLDKVFHDMAAALKEAARKERAILDNANDCICSFDSSLKFVNVNPACEEFFALSQDEIIATHLFDYLGAEDTEKACVFLSKVSQGVNTGAVTLSIKRADGEVREVLWSSQWAPGEGKTGELFSIFHDVTEHLAAERLKQEVVAMVTHDLRSPLMTVQNYLQFLADGSYGDPGEQAKQYLPGAQRSSERMMRLIGDLLDIEKINSGMMELERKKVSVQKVFQETIEQASNLANDFKVSLVVEHASMFVDADEEKLLRVLANLVSNAIKFSPKGGIVTVSAKVNNKVVTFTVADTGVGIAPEMLDTVFDRFQQARNQTSRTRGGSGLGLTICKALVLLHGGKIWVESKEGSGSRFNFELPLAN
ncbi:PAS domain S-box protein [bacterium]|nr:PAS domain S-box protein [bacterium]MBP9808924.1 PAS domain S-box protein [bacterium]